MYLNYHRSKLPHSAQQNKPGVKHNKRRVQARKKAGESCSVYTSDSGGGDRWVPIDLLSVAPESIICRSGPSRVSTPGMHPSKLCSRQTLIIITAEHNALLCKKLSRPGSPCQLCTSDNGGLPLVHIFLAYLFSVQPAFLPQPQVMSKPLRC